MATLGSSRSLTMETTKTEVRRKQPTHFMLVNQVVVGNSRGALGGE